jgi:putative membrane protein
LVAGLAATAAKSLAERMFPPRVHGEPEPPEVLAEKVAGHALDRGTKMHAGQAIHWGFGAAAGAAYGALAEYYPAATDKEGASFGLALMTLTHGTALPAMGLTEEVEEQTTRERTSEATSHLVYGLVAERVRSFVRSML